VIEIRDADGNRTSSTAEVTAAITTGSGTLVGTAEVAAVNGVATFTDLQINGTGSHTLTFTSTDLTSATSAAFPVAAGPATQLAVITQPAGAVSGVAFTTQPVIELLDVGGGRSTSTASVTAAISDGSGTLVGTATVAAVNGVATFTNLQINGSGSLTLTFTSSGLTSAASEAFEVTQVAASLAIQAQPAGAVTGTAFGTQPVIRILDNAGLLVTTGAGATLSVTAARASGTGTLGGTTSVTAVAGVATFTNLQITGTGAHTLSFSTTTPSLSVTSDEFTVAAGPATQLAVITQPGEAVSGVAFTTQPVIEILDVGGNRTGSTASVTATIASGTGTLVGTSTVTAVDGRATFTDLQINGSGAHTLSFAATDLTTATSNSFTVTQVAASLEIQTQPEGAASGTAFGTQPVVRILDNAGLVVTTGAGATLSVSAARASGTGTLGGTTSVTAVAGVATFTNLQITGSGSHTLTFATGTPSLNVTSAAFTVTEPPAVRLNVGSAPTATVSVGSPLTVPIIVDLSNRGEDDIGSLTVQITWDPTKLNLPTMGGTSAGTWVDSDGDAGAVTVNATQASSGILRITGFSAVATVNSFILRNLNFTALAAGSTAVNAVVETAARAEPPNPPVNVIVTNMTVIINE